MPSEWLMMNTLREYPLFMGQVQACNQPALIRCLGLGSCVGLFLYDRISGIGGGAHIMLPDNQGVKERVGEWLSAELALHELLLQLDALGSKSVNLRAKLIGGANLFGAADSIGQRNVMVTKQLLRESGIYLVAEAVGGQAGRSATFHTGSGQLYLRSAAGSGQVI